LIPLDAIRPALEALRRVTWTPDTSHALTLAPKAIEQLAALEHHLAHGGQVDWVWKSDPRTRRVYEELKRTQEELQAWKDKAIQVDQVLTVRGAELERERQENGRLRGRAEVAEARAESLDLVLATLRAERDACEVRIASLEDQLGDLP
jgi:hypothetical protein